jgi:hypothetical protein
LIDVLAKHLEAEQQRGEIDPALSPNQLAEMLTGIYMYTILNCVLNDFSYSLVERMTNAAEIFMREIA